MTFVMEKMTEADHAKIFTPENIAVMEKYCSVNEEWDPRDSSRWAIDRQRDAIFLFLQIWDKDDACFNYALILNNELIGIKKDSRNVIVHLNIPKHLQKKKEEIHQIIRDAFIVHGHFGLRDPKNESEIPVPIFN
jgi:hypothetical protein